MSVPVSLAKLWSNAAERLHVRSALNPGLWLVAIAGPMLMIMAWMFREDHFLCHLFAISLIVLIGLVLLAFVGLACFAPAKLQSEDYQLRHQPLHMIQTKSGAMELDPTSMITVIANPVRGLRPGSEEREQ